MIRKELVAASAEPLILSLLAKGESYGYAIIQEVKARSDGKLNWTDRADRKCSFISRQLAHSNGAVKSPG